jgi:lipopolysaccharide/colanic/teichoic acid biosynthesis glycosyltransferase
MVHEEFVDRPYRSPFGGAERRPSGPTTLEPEVPERVIAGESEPAAALKNLSEVALVATPEARSPLQPWQAAAQAKGRPGYFLAKRCLDCLLALPMLLALSPVFLVTTLLVRLTSRGPVIYRQERVGFGRRRFVMYKFRSMYIESDDGLHRAAYEQFLRGEQPNGKVTRALPESLPAGEAAPSKKKPTGDPRITPLGYLLRRSSIDELPQLINVLRGDMSLVGPRPPIPYEVGLYEPWHLGRLDTLPGITGLWQVHGRSRVSFNRMVEMDLEYIQKQAFWYDVKLLFLTIPAVLSRKGAY